MWADLVHEAADLVRDQLEARGVELVIDDHMPCFWGDRLRLLEVFQNLIENAIKFMGVQPEPRIEIDAEVCDAEIVCSVQDNGMGIDPRYHEKVFDVSERLNPDVEGTGIGLALVKRIIEAHGGRIWVESEGKRQGSTFIFILPRQDTFDHTE